MGTFILVTTTACNSSHQSMRTSFVSTSTSSSVDGGNPEVLNHCFGLKKVAKNLCFDYLLPNKNLLIHPTSGEAIMLAGRGERIEKRALKLANEDERVLLYLDVTNVQTPLTSNVKESQFSYKENSVVVNINAKEIKESIILKDKEGNVVLNYRIER